MQQKEKSSKEQWQKKKGEILAVADVAKIPYPQSERPAGVTALGIIYIVFGILMVIAVTMIVTFTAMMGTYSSMFGGMMGNTMKVFGEVIVVGVGILTVIEFTIAWALFSGKSYGRIIVIVLSMVDFIVHCVTLFVGNVFAIPHIVLDLATFIYMWKSNVVAYYNHNIRFV